MAAGGAACAVGPGLRPARAPAHPPAQPATRPPPRPGRPASPPPVRASGRLPGGSTPLPSPKPAPCRPALATGGVGVLCRPSRPGLVGEAGRGVGAWAEQAAATRRRTAAGMQRRAAGRPVSSATRPAPTARFSPATTACPLPRPAREQRRVDERRGPPPLPIQGGEGRRGSVWTHPARSRDGLRPACTAQAGHARIFFLPARTRRDRATRYRMLARES
jgi:hypothetical protein